MRYLLLTCFATTSVTKKQKHYQEYLFHALFNFSSVFSLQCAHSCRKKPKTDAHPLPLSYVCVTQRGIYNMRAQSLLVRWGFPKPSLSSSRKSHFSPIICAVIEFTQFTGITFGKAKGRLEVIVSGWVSGWPLGKGGRMERLSQRKSVVLVGDQHWMRWGRNKTAAQRAPCKRRPVSSMTILKPSPQIRFK